MEERADARSDTSSGLGRKKFRLASLGSCGISSGSCDNHRVGELIAGRDNKSAVLFVSPGRWTMEKPTLDRWRRAAQPDANQGLSFNGFGRDLLGP